MVCANCGIPLEYDRPCECERRETEKLREQCRKQDRLRKANERMLVSSLEEWMYG